MSIKNIIIIVIAAVAAAIPVTFTIINLVKLKRKKKSFLFEIIAFILGIIMVSFDYALLEPVYYEEALNFDMGPVVHEAFNRYHLATLIVFFLVGLLSYFALKFYKKAFSPLITAVLLSGVCLGILISVFAVLQLAAAFRTDYATILLVIGIYLFFLNYFILMIDLLIKEVKNKAKEQKDIQYSNSILQAVSRFLMKGSNLFIGAVILLIPLLAILVLLLTLFGQEPDSAIKAFTHTSDWLLSAKVSPPAVENGGHYLCTVSLRGHKRLVKPLRYGIRNGGRIVVNRQLCIANAFEQLIIERFPRFHKRIRSFYDNYGYPVSKLIRSAWAADLVYLLMKPLEWLFLIVLYTFDKKPEDRIALQYLPAFAYLAHRCENEH